MPARQTYESYTVRKGDTLTAIAKRFGTSVAAIAATTGLADPNKIKVGQTLSIPVATAYDAGDVDLAEVVVNVKPQGPVPSPLGDPLIALVNGAAEWMKPPKLWVTLAVAAGVGWALISEPRPRRPRRLR